MKIKNLAIGVVSLIVLLVCVWLGASILIGRTTSQKLEALISKPLKPNAPVRIVEHQHEQGLFSSKGQFEIRFNSIPLDADTGKQVFSVLVTYQVANLLLPDSMMRFDWSSKLAGETGKEIDRLFGKELTLGGKGKLGYGGRALTSLKMPELVLNEGSDKLIITPSTGFVSWKDKSLNFDWKTDRVSYASDSGSLEMEGISMSSDLQNRLRGVGVAQFSVDKFSTKEVTFTGYTMKSIGTERQDRIDYSLNQKLASASAANEKISNVVLDFSITDLDIASVEVLANVLDEAADKVQNWTDDDKQRSKQALRTMIEKGFKMSFPKIYAEYGKGNVDGSVQFEVLKADGNPTAFDIAKSVRASGQMTGNGKLLDQSQKAMVMMFGIAKETKEGLKASFDFSGTKLTVNGKVQDVSDSVAQLNEGINELLYGK